MIKEKIFFNVVPFFASLLIRFIGWTIKWELINYEQMEEINKSEKPVIFAFWHGRLIMIPYLCRGKKPHVLISQHRDGELIARIIKYFGLNSIRGSTTRGGKEGFKRIIYALKNGSDVVIAPDGPKGPPYKAQHGIVRLASITGCPIIPISYSTSSYKKFRSWDEFMLPAPFGKGILMIGDPITVPLKAPKEIIEEKRIVIENILNEITFITDSKTGVISKKNDFTYQKPVKNPIDINVNTKTNKIHSKV
ncbi:lysophospholipid acyltransferase family protein [bacterium]|nr:lysophospholipid acyltransferase family protein [bacterium]